MLLLRSWGAENLIRMKVVVCQPWRPGGKKIWWKNLTNWCTQLHTIAHNFTQLHTISHQGTRKMHRAEGPQPVGSCWRNWFSRVRKLARRAAAPFSSFNAWHGELLPTLHLLCTTTQSPGRKSLFSCQSAQLITNNSQQQRITGIVLVQHSHTF